MRTTFPASCVESRRLADESQNRSSIFLEVSVSTFSTPTAMNLQSGRRANNALPLGVIVAETGVCGCAKTQASSANDGRRFCGWSSRAARLDDLDGDEGR